jgi:hypothetical protein
MHDQYRARQARLCAAAFVATVLLGLCPAAAAPKSVQNDSARSITRSYSRGSMFLFFVRNVDQFHDLTTLEPDRRSHDPCSTQAGMPLTRLE